MANLVIEELKPRNPDRVAILHLTDLHFGRRVVTEGAGKSRFLQHLEEQLKDHKPAKGFDLICVTGDVLESANLSQTAHLAELKKAKAYLYKLCDSFGLNDSRLLVIPGNHDYRFWGLVNTNWGRDTFDLAFGDAAKHRFYSDIGLLVACFDSNASKHIADLACGFVDVSHADELVANLAQKELIEAVRYGLALVHHHVLPVQRGEHTDPFSRLERVIRKTIVGSPEFMLLRNSGRFLQKLCDLRMDLVLHGHLHNRGHLRVAGSIADTFIDVVSGASLVDNEGKHSFGVLSIDVVHGTSDYKHVTYDRKGIVDHPECVPTAGYDVTRLRGNRRCATQSAADLTCDAHLKVWEVSLPRGDLLTTEVVRDLRAVDGAKDTLTLRTGSSALTRSEFKTHVLSGDYGLEPRWEAKPELLEFQYHVKFSPPLAKDKPISLAVQRRSEGVMFASQEVQRRWNPEAQASKEDACSHKVRWVTDRLDLTLRFTPTSETPANVMLRVFDESGKLSVPEAQSGAVMFHFWRPDLLPAARRVGPIPSAEARVTVIKPKLWHTYELYWPLPEEENIPNRASLRAIEQALSELPHKDARRERAESFLQACLDLLKPHIESCERGAWRNDDTLRACLFAYDDRVHQLRCVAGTQKACSVRQIQVRWGRDVIGTAHRRGEAFGFDRARLRHTAEAGGMFGLPESVQCVLAIPLYCYAPDGYPAAILALVSDSAHSPLRATVSRERTRAYFESVYKRWMGDFPAVLDVPPDPSAVQKID